MDLTKPLNQDEKNARMSEIMKWRDLRASNLGLTKPRKFHVECGDNADGHMITVMPGGAIIWHDHTREDLVSKATMATLIEKDVSVWESDENCIVFYRFLTERKVPGYSYSSNRGLGIAETLSHFLRDKLGAIFRRKNEWRKEQAEENCKKKTSIDALREVVTQELLASLPTKLAYRTLMEDVWDGVTGDYRKQRIHPGYEIKIEMGGDPLISCEQDSKESGYGRRKRLVKYGNPRLKLTLPAVWIPRVFKKGLAFCEGNLVLDIYKAYPNGTYFALVGKQGYGYSITSEYAIIDPTRDHVSFLPKNKGDALFETERVPRRRRTKAELAAVAAGDGK